MRVRGIRLLLYFYGQGSDKVGMQMPVTCPPLGNHTYLRCQEISYG
jgi:hypothetical protein